MLTGALLALMLTSCGVPGDADGDGWSVAAGDRADGEPSVYPGAPELPYAGYDQDCDAADPAIPPGAEDVAGDGVDQDCSGADRATCPSTYYADDRTLWISANGASCWAEDHDEDCRLPEWATCSGITATWEATSGV